MSKKERILIFLPGNPSIPNIYTDFLDQLMNILKCDQVYDLIHLGQDPSKEMSFSSITLDDVIKTHKENVHDILKMKPEAEVILVGHSLGCTVLADIYSDFSHTINKIYLLMPFVIPLGRNKLFVQILGKRLFNKSLLFLCFLLIKSKGLREIVSRKYGKEKSKLLVKNMLNKDYLINLSMLLLSYHETFKKNDFIAKLLEIEPSKIEMIFAQNDFWSPTKLIKKFPSNINYKIDDELSHDFCLTKKETKRILSHIKESL